LKAAENNDKAESELISAFELSLTEDLVRDFNKEAEHIQVYLYSFGELFDALTSDILSDLNYVQMAVFLIMSYSILFLGTFDPVFFRGVAGLVGVICVFLAYTSSFGFCSLLGLRVAGVHNLLLFLLLGIGVDDMFVIAS